MAKSKWPQVKEQLQLVEHWSQLGLTEDQIARNLGIDRSTLGEFKNKYPELQLFLLKMAPRQNVRLANFGDINRMTLGSELLLA
jgi:DNA-binding XRE family transcriptional regulator